MKNILLVIISLLLMTSCTRLMGFREPKTFTTAHIDKYQKSLSNKEAVYRIDGDKFIESYKELQEDSSTDNLQKLLQPMQIIVFDKQQQLKTHLVNCFVGGFPLKWNRTGSMDRFPILANGLTEPAHKVSAGTIRHYLVPKISNENWENLWKENDYVYFVLLSYMTKPHSTMLQRNIRRHQSKFAHERFKVIYVVMDDLYLMLEK